MEKQSKQTSTGWALVTGASAGIGAEFCRQLAAKGFSIVLIARRVDKLEALAGELKAKYNTNSHIIAADLSVNGASKAIADQLAAENIEVDYLVNNAGFGLPGSFHVPQWQEHADFIQLMMTAVCDLTYQLLPGMQARRRGYIVNVASVAGLVPSPAGHTLYGATKAFLIKFSEALAAENLSKGVKVTALCPGFTYSEFHDVNNTRESMNKLPKFLWMQSNFVVSECLNAMDKDEAPAAVVPGWQYRALIWINRHSPWLFSKLMNSKSSQYRKTE